MMALEPQKQQHQPLTSTRFLAVYRGTIAVQSLDGANVEDIETTTCYLVAK